MTDFTNLAVLVAQGQALLDLVKGGHITQLEADSAAKLRGVDKALAAKIAQANTAIANATAPINDKIPRIQLSKNQELITTVGSVPDYMFLNKAVTSTLIATINAKEALRDSAQLDQLSEISADVIEQFPDFDIRKNANYIRGFSIIRLDWDYGADFDGRDYIAFMDTRSSGDDAAQYPLGAEVTSAAFVKLISGEAIYQWTNGNVEGKWRFCHETSTSDIFAEGRAGHPLAKTQVGSMLIALPVTTTGTIDHPYKLFKNIEIG
jgi:hypothetical protein